MQHKRHGDDFEASPNESKVMGEDLASKSQKQRSAWLHCQQRLATARKYLSQTTTDNVLNKINENIQRPTMFSQTSRDLSDAAEVFCRTLQTKHDGMVAAHHDKSLRLHQINADVASLQQRQRALLTQLQEGLDHQHEIQQEIARFQEEATSLDAGTKYMELERQLHVPRLRHQLSLYAACTRIRWDFTEERRLAGEVVRMWYVQNSLYISIILTLHQPIRVYRTYRRTNRFSNSAWIRWSFHRTP